jgi:hypothetical protein
VLWLHHFYRQTEVVLMPSCSILYHFYYPLIYLNDFLPDQEPGTKQDATEQTGQVATLDIYLGGAE